MASIDDLTVICGTFGDESWIEMANTRALRSAGSIGLKAIHVHDETLAMARNAALAQVETILAVVCDADDELQAGFGEAVIEGHGDVRVPTVNWVRPGRRSRLFRPSIPVHNHECTRDCLPYGNWVIVGSVAYTALLREVGGWDEYGWSEDWATWLKCWKVGASFERISDAVYSIYYDQNSRNHSGPGWDRREYWHETIAMDILGEVPR